MFASRLQLILLQIISPTPSAFLPGRIINNNDLVAYESFHTIKKKRQGKEGSCAIKMDMHKANDSVEWVLLEAIMLRLGFHAYLVKLVLMCVSSMEYRVKFNLKETDCFHRSEGEILP